MTSECWVEGAEGSGFDVDHLPWGVFAPAGEDPRVGVRIGDRVLDVAPVLDDPLFRLPALNPFLARGPGAWASARARLQDLLTDPTHTAGTAPHLHALDDVALQLPWQVADYVDFYGSIHHATNVGRILRPDDEPLLPNWRHLPVGYHGRAGTVVVSDTPVRRPCGIRLAGREPAFGPSLRLDVEAEVGFVVGVDCTPPDLAQSVFGVVLLNDWSARDIQAFEYKPLGPFLGKSFATSVAAWVTPLAALEQSRVPGPAQTPEPAAHLRRTADWGLDLLLELEVDARVVSRPPYASTYWTADQMLAHLTSNGTPLRTGDLFASGTVSGPEPGELGCLLELTRGQGPFLADGDLVRIGAGTRDGRIRLGDVRGEVLPALPAT